MAFLQFFGGAAKRGLKKIEDNEAIIDKSINLFTQLGIPAYKARKELKKQNRQMAETLRDNGFGVDAIGTILSQGKGQKVVDYLDKMSAIGRKANVADVVKFLPTYEESGLSMDEMLESVVGKVNRGMTMSDAVMDATGQKSETTFGKFFSGTNRKLVEKRLSTYKSAFGEGMLNDLRALAVGDVSSSYFPKESRGTISLYDPAAAALLAGREADKDDDAITSTTLKNDLNNRLTSIIGLEKAISFETIPDGMGGFRRVPMYEPAEKKLQGKGFKMIDKILSDLPNKKRYSFAERKKALDLLENMYNKNTGNTKTTITTGGTTGGTTGSTTGGTRGTTKSPKQKASDQIDALLVEITNNKTNLIKPSSQGGGGRLGAISLEIKRLLKITQPTISQVDLDKRATKLILDAMK